MAMSTYLQNLDLDARYGSGTPATIYVALSTADPTADASGLAEPSGNGYARLAVTNNATNFPAASAGAKSNGAALTFTNPTGAWGTITHVALFDASSGGNMLDYGALASSKVINDSSTPVEFAIGELDITRS